MTMDSQFSAASLLDGGWTPSDREDIQDEYDLTDEEVDCVVADMKAIIRANHFAGYVQVFEDNGGDVMIVGQRKDGRYNIMTGLAHDDLIGHGVYDMTHFDDLDMYDGDVNEILDGLADDLDDPMGYVWAVAEYDGTTLDFHKDAMDASLGYFGF